MSKTLTYKLCLMHSNDESKNKFGVMARENRLSA